MSHKIEFESPLLEQSDFQLFSKLGNYNKNQYSNYQDAVPFGFFINEDNKLIGGLKAELWHNNVHIKRLFVDQSLRGKGWGRRLLENAENFGHKKGAKHAYLETLSFQNALTFYYSQGYQLLFKEEEFDEGVTLYHLRKKLGKT